MNLKTIHDYQVRMDVFYEAKNHLWVEVQNGVATIGMTPLVQETSGSFVAIQMDDENKMYKQNERFGSVEAEKHVGQLFIPLSGTILEVNEMVVKNPRLINTDPYGDGWLVKIKTSNLDAEKHTLLQSEEEITIWFESEIEKYKEKGWIAQPHK